MEPFNDTTKIDEINNLGIINDKYLCTKKYTTKEQNPLERNTLIEEKYTDNTFTQLETRTFYKNDGNIAYTEIFPQIDEENKYLSKLQTPEKTMLGYRCYNQNPANNIGLEYITVYKNDKDINVVKDNKEWNIYEEKLNYFDIIEKCLINKNENLIGDQISGLKQETIIFNTGLEKSKDNNNVIIYNKNNMYNTVFKEGWFKGKDKNSLLKELNIVNSNNKVGEEYKDKLILIPISQYGHATTMLVDTHYNDINNITLNLFDSSFYHKQINPFKTTVKNNIFGNKISQEINLLNKTSILQDMSILLNPNNGTGYNINTNFGYLQENGTCAYWQHAFARVICRNNDYKNLPDIQNNININNGKIIQEMCVELDKIFIPSEIFKGSVSENEEKNYIKINDNFYINKSLAHKNQFVNLAKLQQRLNYPQKLNCEEFKQQIKQQKVLREKLEVLEPYLNINANMHYISEKKQLLEGLNKRNKEELEIFKSVEQNTDTKQEINKIEKNIKINEKQIQKFSNKLENLEKIKQKYVINQEATENIKLYLKGNNNNLDLNDIKCKKINTIEAKQINNLKKEIIKDTQITKTQKQSNQKLKNSKEQDIEQSYILSNLKTAKQQQSEENNQVQSAKQEEAQQNISQEKTQQIQHNKQSNQLSDKQKQQIIAEEYKCFNKKYTEKVLKEENTKQKPNTTIEKIDKTRSL